MKINPLEYDKPTIGQLYWKVAYESFKAGQAHLKAPPGYGFAYYLEDALDRYHLDILWPFDTSIVDIVDNKPGLGAPLAASPTRTTPPQSGGKREAPQRASGDAKHRRAHKCPKGHYWSYKHKKCVKSKFR